MVTSPKNVEFVSAGTRRSAQATERLIVLDSTGAPRVVPKQAAARADMGALTSAAATGGDAPTEAEYNALRTDVLTLRTLVNDLLAKMRTAEQLAT